MTQATNSALGEIRLAGDLAGNNNALAPALTTVNSSPGTVDIPSITVDTKGRVTAMSAVSGTTLAALLPDASASQKGVIRVGTGLTISNSAAGYQEVNFAGTLTGGSATSFTTDGAFYTFTLTRDGTAVAVSLPGSSMQTVTAMISAVNAVITPAVMSLSSGNIRITSGTVGAASSIAISSDNFFQYITGYVSISSAVPGTVDGSLSVVNATSSVKGVASFNPANFSVSGGSVSFLGVSDATYSTKGIVQIGAGLSVTGGVVSVTAIPDASPSVKGLVQIGSGINVTSGVISIPDASPSFKGVVQVGTGLSVSGGVLSTSITTATSGVLGLVQIGTGINVSSGVISIPVATTSTAGTVIVGSGLSISSGILSANAIPDATGVSKGLVQIGAGISVSGGVISVAATGDATTSTKGLVQINPSSYLTISSGVLGTSIPDASAVTKGLVQVGTGLSATGGVLSTTIGNATAGVPGLVTVGSGLSVSGGVITPVDATTSSKGVVKISTSAGLSVSAGVLSAVDATNTVKGVVRSANTSNISISSGQVDVGANIPKLNTANTYTKAQVIALVSGGNTGATTVTPNFANGNVFFYTATGNFTLAAPTNVVAGGTYLIIVQQDGTGDRTCTFNSAFKFGTGAVSTISSAANSTSVISVVAQATGTLLTTLQVGF